MWVDDHATPIVLSNKFVDGLADGIVISDNGMGQFKSNKCEGNALCGCVITRNAAPNLDANSFTGNKKHGVQIADSGSPTLKNNVIAANFEAGISVETDSAPAIGPNNVIEKGIGDGILWTTMATGSFFDCIIRQNWGAGLKIMRGANPLVTRSKFISGESHAIVCMDNGAGLIDQNMISGSANTQVILESSASTIIRRCHIVDGLGDGVMSRDGGGGVVEGTLIARNTGVGLHMRANGLTSVTKCDIGPNNGRGVVLAAGSGGSIENCSIHSNNGDAVWVETGSSTGTLLQGNAVTAPAGEKDAITETLRGKNATLHSSGSIAVSLWSHPTVAPAAGARLNAFDT